MGEERTDIYPMLVDYLKIDQGRWVGGLKAFGIHVHFRGWLVSVEEEGTGTGLDFPGHLDQQSTRTNCQYEPSGKNIGAVIGIKRGYGRELLT